MCVAEGSDPPTPQQQELMIPAYLPRPDARLKAEVREDKRGKKEGGEEGGDKWGEEQSGKVGRFLGRGLLTSSHHGDLLRLQYLSLGRARYEVRGSGCVDSQAPGPPGNTY